MNLSSIRYLAIVFAALLVGCSKIDLRSHEIAGGWLATAPPPRVPPPRRPTHFPPAVPSMDAFLASPTALPDNVTAINIRDFGASPDNAPADNAIKIQSALDALAARLSGSVQGEVIVPATGRPFLVDRTLFVPDNVTLLGEGRGSMLSASPGMRSSVLQLGIERLGAGQGIGSDHRVALRGVFDGSVTEQRYGLSTQGNAYGWFQSSPLNLGMLGNNLADYWESTPKLTIDTMVDLPANLPPRSVLFGMSDSPSSLRPMPWLVTTGDAAHPNTVVFAFKSQISRDRAPDAKGDYSFFFSLGHAGRHRLSIEVDLTAGRAAAFVDGAQVAISPVSDNCGPADPASCHFNAGGKTFWTNNHVPFGIGAAGIYGPMGRSTPITPFELDALKVTAEWRYNAPGAGAVQSLANGQALNDFVRFFSFRPALGAKPEETRIVALLPLTENGSEAGGQTISVYNGDTNTWLSGGLFLRADFDYRKSFHQNTIRSLRIVGNGGGAPTVALGPVPDVVLDHVEVAGGLQAIASFPNTYPDPIRKIRMQEITASAGDSALYFALTDAFAQSLSIDEYRGSSIRLDSASATIVDLLVAPWMDTWFARIEAYGGDYGGQYLFKNISLDAEGSRARAAVYVESSPSRPTSLILDTFNGGTVDYCDPNPADGHAVSDNTFVMLRQTGLSDVPAMLYVRNAYFYNPYWSAARARSCAQSLFDVDGPAWHGLVPNQGFGDDKRSLLVHLTPRWGSSASLAIDGAVSSLMAAGAWPNEDNKARVPSVAPPLDPSGQMVADIRNFGASPSASAAVNTRAIQAAVEWMASRVAGGPSGASGTIYIPSGRFPINDTIYVDNSWISFRGEGGQRSQLVMDPSQKVPVLYFGPRRSEFPGGSTAYRVDLATKLDASVASDSVKRYGIRTNRDSYGIVQASPMNLGKLDSSGAPTYWQTTQQITFDFCVEPPDGGFPTNTVLFGIGRLDSDLGFGRANPFAFMTRDNNPSVLRVLFTTADANGKNLKTIDEDLPLGDSTRMHRVSVQLDLIGQKITAFSDGTQILSHALQLGSSRYLNRNDHVPLLLGVRGGSGGANGPSYLPSSRGTQFTDLDFRLYGLHLSEGLRYADGNAVGSPQRFLPDASAGITSSTPLTDKLRFFTPTKNTIALLPLTDAPVPNPSSPHGEARNGRISVRYGDSSGGGVGAGLFLSIFNGYDISDNQVQGLGLVGATGGAPALAYDAVLRFKVDRVEAIGSLQGLANYPNLVSGYPTDVTNSHFAGTDAATYLYFNIAQYRDVVLEPSRGSEIRSWSSANHFQGVTIHTAGKTFAHYFEMNDSYGTLNLLEDVSFAGPGADVESAALLMYQAAYSNLMINLDTIKFNSVGSGTLIKLVDLSYPNDTFVPAQFNARHLTSTGGYGFVYESNGPSFHGLLPPLESAATSGSGFWDAVNQFGSPSLVAQ